MVFANEEEAKATDEPITESYSSQNPERN